MLAGRPMLQWVYDRACASQAAEVLVATDDARIAAACRSFAAPVEMTSAAHRSGTDRIAEVAQRRGWSDVAIVVNVQGDEPMIAPRSIDQVAALLQAHPAAAIATLVTPIHSSADLHDPNIVKVVADVGGRALYFSRAPIPFARDAASADHSSPVDATRAAPAGALRHIGIYAYRVAALRALAAAPVDLIEDIEKLEQLRAMRLGMLIQIENTSEAPAGDVNTPADIARLEQLLTQR